MMHFDHLHFYVTNAQASRDWFIQKLGFQAQGCVTSSHIHTEIVQRGKVYFLLSSPVNNQGPVAEYLHQHPPGVIDVAFQVDGIESVVQNMKAEDVKVIQPIQQYSIDNSWIKWCTVVGWSGLHHTLVEQQSSPHWKLLPSVPFPIPCSEVYSNIIAIDHTVLNLNSGDLKPAVNWYKRVFGLVEKQTFDIQTERSGLYSQVLVNPENTVKFPINEPTSETSQIQEFIDYNRGPGIQHIALRTDNIIQLVPQLRQQGLPFISISPFYYHLLKEKNKIQEFSSEEWQQIQQSEILLDRSELDAILLQIFTQPIFDEPTFFFEFIERRKRFSNGYLVEADGFGEGNFQALFEAMEQEQIKRNENQSIESLYTTKDYQQS
ncbi:MAG: 4-hydroxyphenylpyruvate dioxygenase [Cyanobacteria bacterium J06592_8]